MRRLAARAAVLVTLTGMAMALVSPTEAEINIGDSDGRGTASGGSTDGQLTAEASSTEIVISGDTGGGGGSLEAIDSDWSPPVCWYEPWMTAEEFSDWVETMAAEDGRADRALNINSPAVAFTDIYRDNKPDDWAYNTGSKYAYVGYENYNLDANEDGLWWRPVVNPNAEDDLTYGTDCPEPIFWGDPVEESEVEGAVTDEILAEYAYEEISIPETEIEMSPADDDQVVNLSTWIWMEESSLEPRTVRAELPVNGLWAETTAEPVSLRIDPGTEDAEVFPSSGECAISEDGRIGEPWDANDEGEDPPCGVTYLRSGTYELTVSLTWEVSWTGSQTEGRNSLPSGTFETTHTVVVEEVQTIVR